MKRRVIQLLFLGFLVVLFLMPVRSTLALPIPIVNPSFEDDVLSDGDWTENSISGWGIAGSAGTINPTVGPPSALDGEMFFEAVPDGENVAWLNGGYIGQWVDATLLPNCQYTLQVYVGFRQDLDRPPPTYALRLIEATPDGGWDTLTETTPHALGPPAGTFELATLTYESGSVVDGGRLGINIITDGIQVNFDDVRLEAAVPEPATVLLLGTGLLGLAWLGRKKFLRKS